MIIDSWEVVKYNYIIVFILSFYMIGSMIYIFYNYKKKTWIKVLIHFIIGAIIALAISYTIASISHKTVNIVYQYESENEVLLMIEKGWTLESHNRQYQKVHLSKKYKKTKIRWFYPSRGEMVNDLD